MERIRHYRRRHSNKSLALTVFIILATVGWMVNHKYNIIENISETFRDPQSRGVTNMQAARFDQAERNFTKAVAENPRNAETVYSLAWSLQAQGKDDEAMKNYLEAEKLAKAAKLNSILEQIYTNVGAIHLKRRKFQDAEMAFRSALKVNTRSVDINYQLGMTMKAQQKIGDARQMFKQTLKLDPSYLAAKYQLDLLDQQPTEVKIKKHRKPASLHKRHAYKK